MKLIRPNRYFTGYAILLLLISVSCGPKKNTFVRRVFNNLTGHYNQFWNGRESFREGVAQLETTVKDNYNKILPVYNYGTKNEAQQLNSFMDRAIEKASLNIQNHSMYFNHKEWVKWIDDSYMLIGKAYFYKHEFNQARRTFEFVINEYKDSEIRYEAMLWLAKSYVQLGKYKKAESALDNLRNEIDKAKKPPKEVVKAVPLVTANMFILQEKYDQAKEQLKMAIRFGQKRVMEARARFILGQIFQKEDILYKATEYYAKVIKMNPPYEMAFNAAINLAQCYESEGGNSKSIIKKLQKLLKEDKNKDFRDQIYYALADVEFKNGEDSLAINYLRLSVATSVSNDFQKATSSLKLAGIFFTKQEYQLSQAYYDTAVQVLPEDFPNAKEIKAKHAYLSELVNYLVIVQTQDSLQKIAGLSEEERNAVIDKIIAKLVEEEQKALEEQERLAALAEMGVNQQPGTGIQQLPGSRIGGAKWYFYNPNTKSTGYNEFIKKWGKRKLEDNWWLLDKKSYETVLQGGEETTPADTTTSDSTTLANKTANDPHYREYYLKDLPFTAEQVAASNELIDSALYQLGFIYKDKLENYKQSINSFEDLITRFPDTKHLMMAYYQLFKLYSNIDSLDKAEYYKNLLVEKFPGSDYAKLLTDPDYYKKLEEEKNRALTLYKQTYDYYSNGDYYMVFSNCERALSQFEEPKELLAKFAYLRALALGKIEVVDSLKTALDDLVKNYPGTEVTPLAQNILDYLNGGQDSTGVAQDDQSGEQVDFSIYNYQPNSKQMFAVVTKGDNVNVNALKIRISDFNTKFYRLENLSITAILLDKTTNFIMVGDFDNAGKAMTYFNAITANDYVFANLDKKDYDTFVISRENYPVFYRDKDIKKYLAFFKKYYVKQ